MIQDCKKKKIDLILTKSISRFARNTLDSIQYVRMLKSLGVTVIFEKENINTATMNSEMILTVLSAFAQAESESISQNVARGKLWATDRENLHFLIKICWATEKEQMESQKSSRHKRKSSV